MRTGHALSTSFVFALNSPTDKVIERQILDRRQLHQETFNAFAGAVERLAQQLTKPMSESRKLDILLENMRDNYKPFLTIYRIDRIEELVTICHGLDKAMYRSYTTFQRNRHLQVNNIENVEQFENVEEESEEELNAISQAINRKKNFEKPKEPSSQSTETLLKAEPGTQNNILCLWSPVRSFLARM